MNPLICRPRRNRRSSSIRALVEETSLSINDIIAPMFVCDGKGRKEQKVPYIGMERYSKDLLVKECETLHRQGIQAIALFPITPKEKKDPFGSEAFNDRGLAQETIRLIKKNIPSLTVIADVALDPYTSHGHDGILNDANEVDNDKTVNVLKKQSLSLSKAGADIIAPSDMMDGRVFSIRQELDSQGFYEVSILSYTAKYASCFYAPFRDTVESKLSFGDKKTYQMSPSNCKEALLEASLDVSEGADLLLVKPATHYLDIISKISESTLVPVGAYHVSGEYCTLMAAAEKGLIDENKALHEVMISIKRAGARFIFTYGYKQLLKLVKSGSFSCSQQGSLAASH